MMPEFALHMEAKIPPETNGASGFAPAALCRQQLAKIASSNTFLKAGQLQRLLSWLGDWSLDHPETSPSEKQIAEMVLRRKDFDPQSDSLVRKEMSRLREKLARYYTMEGGGDVIVISAASGYLLQFAFAAHRDTGQIKLCWLVLPFRTQTDLSEESVELFEDVLLGLAEHSGLELIAPTTALAYRERSGDVRSFAAECRADFVVEGSLRRRDQQIQVALWLIDGKSGRAHRSVRITGVDPVDLARLAVSWLLESSAGAGKN